MRGDGGFSNQRGEGIIEQTPGGTGLDLLRAENDGKRVRAGIREGIKAILDLRKAQIKRCNDQVGRALEPFLDTLVLQSAVLRQLSQTRAETETAETAINSTTTLRGRRSLE